MNHQVPAGSTTQSSSPADDVRPVLAAMIGPLRARRATITHVLDGFSAAFSAGLVVLSLHKDMPAEDVSAVHDALGNHLAGGGSVLLNAANHAKADRRALLIIAARYWASTLAVVCPSRQLKTTLIASLPDEGWQAVVVAR